MSGPNPSVWASPPPQAPDPSVWASPAPKQSSRLNDRLNLLWKIVSLQYLNDPEFQNAIRSHPSAGQAFQKAGGSLLELAKSTAKFLNPVDIAKQIASPSRWQENREQWKPLMESPISAVLSGVGEGIVGMAAAPVEAISGVTVKEGQAAPLSEDERGAAIMETAANIVGLVAGAGAGVAVTRAQAAGVARTLAKTTTDIAAIRAGEKAAEGAAKRAFVKGLVEGGVGGAAYGAVINPDDLDQALVTSFLFAPAGAVLERARLKGKSTDLIGTNATKTAAELNLIRKAQATSGDSFIDVVYKWDGLDQADNIAEAVLLGRLHKEESFIIPGVSSEAIPGLIQKIASGESKMVPQFRQRSDGLFDMAVLNKQTPEWLRATQAEELIPHVLGYAPGIDFYAWDPTDPRNGGTKVGPQAGSNPGGTYELPFRGTFYIKEMDLHHAWNEAIANRIYKDLGVNVPVSSVAQDAAGKSFVLNEIIPNKGTLRDLGLTTSKDYAKQIIEHTAVDAFLGNWDTVGLDFDNIVVDTYDKVVRVDQGGTLLYRARGAAKDAASLTSLTEFDNFKDPKINPTYSKLIDLVGEKQFNKSLKAGINKVIAFTEAIENTGGGWRRYVSDIAPNAPSQFRDRIASILETRTQKLVQFKQDKIVTKLDIPKLATKYLEREQKLFDQTGFLFNDIVSHNGVDYVVADAAKVKGGTPQVKAFRFGDDSRKLVTISIDELRRNPEQTKLVFHGTTRVFDEFDPKKFQPRSEGRGVFSAEEAKLASEYYSMGGDDYYVGAQNNIEKLEKELIQTEAQIEQAKLNNEPHSQSYWETVLNNIKNELVISQGELDRFLASGHRPNIRIANIVTKTELDMSGDVYRPARKVDIERIKAQAIKEHVRDLGLLDLPNVTIDQVYNFFNRYIGYLNHNLSVGENISKFLERAGYTGLKRNHSGMGDYVEHITFDPKNVKPGFPIYDQAYGIQDAGKEIYNDFNTWQENKLIDERAALRIRLDELEQQRVDLHNKAAVGSPEYQNIVAGPEYDAIVTQVVETRNQLSALDVDRSFNQTLRDYAEARGFNRRDLPALENTIIRELEKDISADTDIMKIFKERDSDIVSELTNEAVLDQAELVRKALTNGLFIDAEDGGHLTIRDRDGYKLGRFKTNRDALSFIQEYHQTPGSDLTGGSALPPRFGGGILTRPDDAPRPFEAPYVVNRNNLGERFFNNLGSGQFFNWATQPLTLLRLYDEKFGLKLNERIGDPGKVAWNKMHALIQKPMERLGKIVKPVEKLSRDRREVIAGYMETLRPIEDATPSESATAATIVRSGVDLTNVMKYRNSLDKLVNSEIDANTMQSLANKLKTQYHIGPTEERIANLMLGPDRPGVVAKLVREAGWDKNYVINHKMTGAEIKAATDLLAFNEEIGADGLGPILTHARLYTDGNIEKALQAFSLPENKSKFFAEAFRNGEIEAYELDPFMASARVIRSQGKIAYMNKFIRDAKVAMAEELSKVDGGARAAVNTAVSNYLGDLQGIPSESRAAAQAWIEEVNKRRGWNLDKDAIHTLVTIALQTVDAAFQGGRFAYAGLRDFAQPVMMYETDFGTKATSRMLDYAAKGYDGIGMNELLATGEIPDYNLATIVQADDPGAGIARKSANTLVNWLDATNKTLFRYSGQGFAYKRIATGITLERWDTASKELLKLSRNEISKQQAYDNMKIQRYDPPVQETFDSLVRQEKYEDATRFLARATVEDNLGYFMQGNRSRWNRREIGRLGGQFGQWTPFYINYIRRGLTRGTKLDRGAFLAKTLATQAAFVGAGAALGINVRPWLAPPAIAFAGGPMVSMASTVYDAWFGYGAEKEIAEWKLTHGTPIFPGRNLLRDLLEAGELASEGDPRSILRAAGYRPTQ